MVVDAPFRGCGLGRALYQEVFARAKSFFNDTATTEIYTIPYNKESLDFHKVMGFHEVGVQSVRNNSVRVSLQEAPVAL